MKGGESMSGKMVKGALLAVAKLAFTEAKPVAMRLHVTGIPRQIMVYFQKSPR